MCSLDGTTARWSIGDTFEPAFPGFRCPPGLCGAHSNGHNTGHEKNAEFAEKISP